jgi:hypothetical protein
MIEDSSFSPSENRAFHPAAAAWLKRELDRGLCSRPSAPATKGYWEQLRNRIRTVAGPFDGI